MVMDELMSPTIQIDEKLYNSILKVKEKQGMKLKKDQVV